jgi:hypothetical protein
MAGCGTMRAATARVTPGRVAQEVEAPMPSHLTTPQPRIAGRFASLPVHERFWAKVNKDGPVPEYAPHLGPCWLWTAGLYPDGYGHFWNEQGFSLAHRWLYEQERGPIPDGLESDHLCRVRSCVRLSHIELVISRANILRGESFAAHNATATHCPTGHPYDLLNTYRYPDGSRACRICRAASRRARTLRVAAARGGGP